MAKGNRKGNVPLKFKCLKMRGLRQKVTAMKKVTAFPIYDDKIQSIYFIYIGNGVTFGNFGNPLP